jgi:hypothetical protein
MDEDVVMRVVGAQLESMLSVLMIAIARASQGRGTADLQALMRATRPQFEAQNDAMGQLCCDRLISLLDQIERARPR